ncbi:conserved unknown protein [Ectocarpus siliculosus]|uniref:PPM-type phosphatase domain-containing protein n=1 Tax=Ectocarpus siliculosus TaxID=2880 RepID=D7FP40_ECTSI|nr:conserved unknown protein [Ectocarpus siliculosus]|eukprot:CBJ30304.1 conserved unknown protein [Ectocarpus siliculosus]
MIARRRWQMGATLGGGGVGAAGGSARPLIVRQSSNGHSRPGSPEVVTAGRGSRLPLLDSTPTLPQQQQTQRQRSMHVSAESNDLFEHGLSFGVSTLKGHRPYMEDEFKVIPNLELNGGASDLFRREGRDMEPTHFFGMFDGHAGGRCSKALTHILGQTVSREPDFSLELQSAVHKGFLRANAEFLRKLLSSSLDREGSTAVTAFVRGRRLVVGNVGDSRAVLCSDGRALPMSSDHKPNKPEERRRIQALGGRVVYSFGVPRVNGILAVSRAFGDRNMKGAVNAEPDVRERSLERHDDFLVLATDGLWDVMTSQEVCNIVYNSAPDVGPQGCSELLTTMALRKGSLDNTSAMVVDLRGLWDVDEGAQPKRAGSVAVAAVDAESAGTAILRQELKALSPSYSSSKQILVNGGGSSGNGVEPDGAGAAGTGDRSRPSSSPGLWASSQVHVVGKREVMFFKKNST